MEFASGPGSPDHELVGRAETGPLVERDGPLARAQHHPDEPLLPRVAEHRVQQLAADALVAVCGQHERVAQVTPARRGAAGPGIRSNTVRFIAPTRRPPASAPAG